MFMSGRTDTRLVKEGACGSLAAVGYTILSLLDMRSPVSGILSFSATKLTIQKRLWSNSSVIVNETGVIERVGEKVTTVQPGDKVVVYPWIGCGSCSRCRQGHDNICDGHTREIGFSNRGGYAQQVWVPHERYVVKLPEGMPLESSCLLPCSGLTAFSALKRTNVSAKDFILFIGMGGVGMMALKLAKLLLHSPIICVDIDDKKLEAAKEAGATFVFNSKTNTELEKDIRSLCNDGKGPECIIDFVGTPSTIDLAVSVLRKNGKLLVVGLLGGEAQIPIPCSYRKL
ncbi:alcohol dehydrogenase [Balamuthia mandrillaris]